tara:strand:+ start:501 stop:800 length:300 start_codon:yes stop_codon:yes gene_type:complete
MSKENLDQFIQQISDSEELQARIGDEIDAESLIALGAEHGCEFTVEDLHAELSDEELDGVAGGWIEPNRDELFREVDRKAFKLKIAGGITNLILPAVQS